MSLSPDQKLAAYFLGRRIAGQRRKQDRVPVAYLYNGVRLPGLPEWDRENYPFAFIYEKGTFGIFNTNEFILLLTDQPLIYSGSSFTNSDTSLLKYNFRIKKSESDEWVDEGASTGAVSLGFATSKGIWTNTDILNGDNSGYVSFHASEPVPVYE